MKKNVLGLLCALLFPLSLSAQTLYPCPAPAQGAENCVDACLWCTADLDNYQGTTSGYAGGQAVGFCGTIENDQWFAFEATAPQMTITAKPSNCANGNGIQLALYDGCQNPAILGCNGGFAGGGDVPVSITANLTPGQTYYLLIDGYAGDQCDFVLDLNPPGGPSTPLGPLPDLLGPDTVCDNSTALFCLADTVDGASAYHWSGPPGMLVDGQPAPRSLTGPDGRCALLTFTAGGGDVCVTASNACVSADSARCRTVVIDTTQPNLPLVLPPVAICADQTPYALPWGATILESGVYRKHYYRPGLCDSIVEIKVQVNPTYDTTLATVRVCFQQLPYALPWGDTVSLNGNYAHTYQTAAGCDSIVRQTVFIVSQYLTIFPGAVACSGTPSYTLPWGEVVTATGTYQITVDSGGCPHLLQQFVQFKPPIIRNLPPVSICAGECVLVCGEQFCETGTYTRVCTSYQGCDSTVNFSVIVVPVVADILGGPVQNCVQTLQSAPSPGTKVWRNAAGAFVGSGNTLTIPQPGVYYLQVSAPASNGGHCVAWDTVFVGPSLGFSISSTVLPAGGSQIANGALSVAPNPPGNYTYQWANPALTGPLLANLLPGEYCVTVTNVSTGCTASECLTVPFTTSVDDASDDTRLRLFPNPAAPDAPVTIQLPASWPTDAYRLEVWDMLGRRLIESRVVIGPEGYQLDLPRSTSGSLLVRVWGDGRLAAGRSSLRSE